MINQYIDIDAWGPVFRMGGSESQFNTPHGMCFGDDGHLYVVDSHNHRVVRLDSRGNYISHWGQRGSDSTEFLYPTGIARDSAGNLYVADSGNHRVLKFDVTGGYLAKWGGEGSGAGQFGNPSAIAVSFGDRIYVGDDNNRRIQVFDTEGTPLTEFSHVHYVRAGVASDDLAPPTGVAVHPDGRVFMCSGLHIYVSTADGTFIKRWGGVMGAGEGEFASAAGLAIDRSGYVFVIDGQAETGNRRVQKFDSDGNFIAQFARERGSDPYSPRSIAVDEGGLIWVADANSNRIRRYRVADAPNHDSLENRILTFLNRATGAEIQARIEDDPLFGSSEGHGITLDMAEQIVVARNASTGSRFTAIRQVGQIEGVGSDTLHDLLYTFWRETTTSESAMNSRIIAWTASRSSTFEPITGRSDYEPLGTEVEFDVQSSGALLVEFGVDLMAEHTGQQAPNFVLVGVAVDGAKPVDSDAIYTGGGFGEATAGFKSDIYSSNARLVVVELDSGPHKLELMGKRSGTGSDAAYRRGGWIKVTSP